MRSVSSSAAVLTGVTLAIVGLAAPARSAGPAALGPAPDCSSWTGLPDGATFYQWTGAYLPDPNNWNQALNWSPTGIPGAPNPGDDPNNYLREDTDYACIADGTVVIPHGNDFAVGGFSFAGATTVTLQPGTRLFANGQDSSIDPAAMLTIDGATLGGSGTVIDHGTIEMYSTWDDQVNPEVPAAAALTTRFCQSTCDGVPDAVPGETDISSTGKLLIDAPIQQNDDQTKTVRGGINLADRRTIVNAGTITLSKDGYIAADNGTTIVNASGGTIDIANNNGIYQGYTNTGPNPALLRNHGLAEKTAGNGTSIIGIDFHQLSGGQIKIESGTLSINGLAAPAATVRQGSTYATGACVPGKGKTCHTRTVGAKGGIGAMSLPNARGSGSVSIEVTQPAPSAVPTEHLVVGSATFGRAKPLGYVLTYGHTIAAGKHKVAVKPKGSSSYSTISPCPKSSTHVPSGVLACLVSKSSDASQKQFTIRGIVANGRWIIR